MIMIEYLYFTSVRRIVDDVVPPWVNNHIPLTKLCYFTISFSIWKFHDAQQAGTK